MKAGVILLSPVTKNGIQNICPGNTFIIDGPVKKWSQGIFCFKPFGFVFDKRTEQMSTLVVSGFRGTIVEKRP
jgi:hypothetical protein